MGNKFFGLGLLIALAIGFTALLSTTPAQAEPWLSNRFANNCASCHAPSRLNLEAKDRRCTLSCQGCHTNPNGGGLRNFYGKWNSQRWLKSLHSKTLNNKKKPLPWFAQRYVSDRDTRKILSALKSKNSRGVNKKIVPTDPKFKKELRRAISGTRYIRKGKPTRRTMDENDLKGKTYSEQYYLRENGDDSWTRTAKSRKQFESRIPRDDPYFQRRRSAFNAGFDLRYQSIMDSKRVIAETKQTNLNATWPMSLDVALELRPFHKNKTLGKIGFITETRYANSPTQTDPESLFYETSGRSPAFNRSAYVIMDDLPYNSFVMYGLYRPMFEYYSSDHNSLIQKLLWSSGVYNSVNAYNVNFKTLSFGTAPNVPFFNAHLIQAKTDLTSTSPSNIKDKGYIVNLGARWVKWGASIRYSLMSLTSEDIGSLAETKTTSSSITAGFTYGRSVTNIQSLILERKNSATNKGSAIGVEQRFRLWKETYLEAGYETANTSSSLEQGSSSKTTFGVRGFLWPGSDASLRYSAEKNDPTVNTATQRDVTSIEAQLHLYY